MVSNHSALRMSASGSGPAASDHHLLILLSVPRRTKKGHASGRLQCKERSYQLRCALLFRETCPSQAFDAPLWSSVMPN